MRIGHVALPSLQVPAALGGANEKIIYELASAQAGSHDVHVFSVGSRDEDTTINGVEYHYVTNPIRRSDTAFYWRVWRRVEVVGLDILHLHASSILALFAKARRSRIPVVGYVNFPRLHRGNRANPALWAIDRALGRLAVKKIDQIAATSDISRQLFAQAYGIETTRIEVVPSGVRLDRFRPDRTVRAAFRDQHHVASDMSVILFVGRICEQKGIHLLAEAVEALRAKGFLVKPALVGPAAATFDRPNPTRYAQNVLSRIAAAGGAYLGQVTEEEVIAAMNGADVLVLPTLEHEMFGMVLVEALACGLKVVASRQGAIPEVVSGADCAWLFRVGDSDDLAQQLGLALAAGAGGDRCRRFAERYSWDRACAEFDVIYERLLYRT